MVAKWRHTLKAFDEILDVQQKQIPNQLEVVCIDETGRPLWEYPNFPVVIEGQPNIVDIT